MPVSPGCFKQNHGVMVVAISAVFIALDIIFVVLQFILGDSINRYGAWMKPLCARRLYLISRLAH